MARPRFSVVIPTHERRELVIAAVLALARQEFDQSFEVVVVVDGSSDGSAAALRELEPPFSLEVLEQSNRGAAAARNQGARAAWGEIVLFLDDDMEADPRLLAEHDRSHREGADVVVGHVPLHPASPATLLSAAVGLWAENRARSLAEAQTTLTPYDLLTGQMSLKRETFERLQGFDGRFTRDGSYGNEDLDFAQRLVDAGCRAVFNPVAISWQRYVVTSAEHLRQWRDTGRADVLFARKFPSQGAAILARRGAGSRAFRLLWRPVLELPGLGAFLSAVMCRPLRRLVEHVPWGIGFRAFRFLRTLEYWRGVRESGGIPRPRAARVLAYHAIADLAGDPVLEQYAVPPRIFVRQLETLERAGYRFIAPDELLRFLRGAGGLPRRSLLLTFDDCYADLLEAVAPILAERAVPAVGFAVTRRLGGSNEWDETLHARKLRLLTPDELRTLSAYGVEIGAHSQTHPRLVRLDSRDVEDEIVGSRRDLEELDLPTPRLFAYPYGEQDERLRGVARRAGFEAAFAIDRGVVRRNQDPLRLPRIEVLRADVGLRLRLKLAFAGLGRSRS